MITADYCMGQENTKPLFCLIALDKGRCISMRNRLPMLKSYCRNLCSIRVHHMDIEKVGIPQEISKVLSGLKG